MKYVFVSHGLLSGGRSDFDAVASLSSLVRFAKIKKLTYNKDYFLCMTDYFNGGLNILKNYYNSLIIIADIPPEVLVDMYKRDGFINFFSYLKWRNNNRIIFLDHHPSNYYVLKFLKNVKNRHIFDYFEFHDVDYERDRLIPLNKKYCAAERVQHFLFKFKYVNDDGVFFKLRVFAHDQDFGIRKIEEALNITYVIGADYNNEKLIHLLSEGQFWNNELEEVKKRHIALTEELCSKMKLKKIETNIKVDNNKRIPKTIYYALLPDDKRLKISAAAAHIFRNYQCDFIILFQKTPFFSIRLPIKETDVSAARIAALFGGGGHYGAASVNQKNKGKFQFPYNYIDENNFENIVNNVNNIISNYYC